MTTIEQIEKATKDFAAANDELTDIKRELSSEFEAIRAKHMNRLKAAIELVVKYREALEDMIADGKHLFVKPKTLTMNGLKVGLQKAKDTLEIKNEQKLIELIEEKYGEDSEFVNITKSVLKTELMKLPKEDLKELKLKITEGQDSVYIKSIDSEIDKFVNALVKKSEEPK